MIAAALLQDPGYASPGIFKGILDGGLISILAGAVAILAFSSVLPILFVWAERRGSGRMQQRLGPNRVGPFGLVQTIADGLKLIVKEDIIPANASRFLFAIAPSIVLAGLFSAFALIPLGPRTVILDAPLGVYMITAFLAFEVIGVIMAGWASNNKWSILGAMREAAQMVSYEVPIGTCLLIGIISHDTLSLRGMSLAQSGGWLNVGGWLIFSNPLFALPACIVFFIAVMAETKRAPFDLPEAESELVSGFHTEYSGIRFAIFFLEEYASMYLVSGMTVCLFLGGWNLPFVPPGAYDGIGGELLAVGAMLFKSFLLVWVMIWVRWTLPRIRIDQVMNLCYKYLTPIAFVCLIGTCFWES